MAITAGKYEQAPDMAVGTAESSHLVPQAGNRGSKLQMAQSLNSQGPLLGMHFLQPGLPKQYH